MIAKSHRWHQVAIAVAALFGLWEPGAMALSLGRVTVQSALGEPLRAEVELLDINAEEAASLKPSVGSPESFKAAGLDYNPALANLQVSLQRRADGRAYIRLSGERTISDPFVDLILETRWSSGRIVRDYTLLFDPPNLRTATATAPIPPQVSPQATVTNGSVATSVPGSAVTNGKPPVPAVKPVVATAPKAPSPTAAAARVTVRPGDTAGKIAAAIKPENVSLDQMLVALLRSNPASFMGDNVNRIKAGAILTVPSADQAAMTPAAEASQMVVAQSRDFNEFRRRLALNAPETPLKESDRVAAGKIETRVEEKKPIASAPDKLTLSKGAIEKISAEDRLAKERSAKEVADRAAELAKNISDLGKLGAASGAPDKPASSSSSGLKGPIAVSQSGASAPAPVATPPLKAPSAATRPEPGFIDGLMQNPWLPAGAIGVIALLAALGVYRSRQRKSVPPVDSVAIGNGQRPDTYFAISGGQNVDTHHGTANVSAPASAPGHLEGVDDVDPVAEADVYLAYGRDLQAEEILKDAMRASPERIAVHLKLLELFAKRRDTKSFEHIATKAFRLMDADSAEWQHIRELGLSIDPGNPHYLAGWQPAEAEGKPSIPAPLEDSNPSATSDATARTGVPTQPGAGVDLDLDLDLDFSLDDELPPPVGETSASVAETAPAALSAPPTTPAPEAKAAPAPAPAQDFEMLEFDIGSLSLDLDDLTDAPASSKPAVPENALATKLALAEEFVAIGDVEGARTLIEEVVAEASGDMKIKAQQALSHLQSL